MAPIKLLIADVDGTLVTKAKVLTSRAREAVDRLRSAGIEFTITSGRPPRGMAMLTEALKLKSPIAAFNGGMFVEPNLTTVIEELLIPVGVATQVVDYRLKEGLDAWVYRPASIVNRCSSRRVSPICSIRESTATSPPPIISKESRLQIPTSRPRTLWASNPHRQPYLKTRSPVSRPAARDSSAMSSVSIGW